MINTLGNRAVHGHRDVPVDDAVVAVRELFHVAYWLAHTYARAERPSPALAFDPAKLPKPGPSPKQTADQLRQLETELRSRDQNLAASDLAWARSEAKGLGLFVRSLVGMEREAAKAALGTFIDGTVFTANQIEFINLIADHLTAHGVIEARRLYESPFTDLSPRGPDGLFTATALDGLFDVLERVNRTASAA